MHWSGNFCQFGARAVDWLAGQLETLASRNGNSHPCQHHHHQCSLCQMRSFMIFLWGTVHAEEEQSCVVLGMGLGGLTYQPVQQLAKITNFEYRFDIVLSIVVDMLWVLLLFWFHGLLWQDASGWDALVDENQTNHENSCSGNNSIISPLSSLFFDQSYINQPAFKQCFNMILF